MAGPTVLAELVERCPAPEAVRAALASLAVRPDDLDRLALDGALAARAVRVMAASRSFTRLILADPLALGVLAEPHLRRPPDRHVDLDDAIAWRQRELLRIAALDLEGTLDLEAVTEAVSEAASVLLEAALSRALEETGGPEMGVIALGKLGARELNYASDVDVVLVSEGDPEAAARTGRRFVELAGRAVRVDTTLRPEGRDGPLVRSLASYEAYWDRWAEPWERQALIKAGPVAGSERLGNQWMSAAAQVVWGRPFDAEALRQVRDLKARTEAEVRRRGLSEREVKRGPGGIRDVEFAVQLLQLVHGAADAALRRRTTLRALDALAAGGYVDAGDAGHLGEGYRWLRRVEHVLQLRDGQPAHAVPRDRTERRLVARVLGYRSDPDRGATARFDGDLASVRARVRSAHERVWFRPLLASFAGVGRLSPEAAAERLNAFGFADATRTREAVGDLTRGLTRSSRMMQQLLPLLFDWLSGSPDPDQGLLGLRRLATGEQRSMELASAFRDSPEAARQLACVLGTSRLLGEILEANPDCIERLADPALLRTRPRPELVESALTAVSWRSDLDDRQRGLQRWARRHLLGIGARDVLGHDDVRTVGADLAAVAEAVLEVSLASLAPAVPMAVIALGRLGGAELGYASDLDLVLVHEGIGAGPAAEAERVAGALLRFVGGATPSGRIWSVDYGLRPEGKDGPLSRSAQAWDEYLQRWAQTWERQAYLRARVVAGDHALGQALVDRIGAAVLAEPLPESARREIRRMKARVQRERLPAHEDPEFHLKLGPGALVDVEFTTQLLQLVHQVPGSSTTAAVSALARLGHLGADEASALADAHRFCERTRNRLFLVAGPGDALPTRTGRLVPLARSLGTTPSGLREQYRRVTRRARRVVEQRFYGSTGLDQA